MVRKPTLPANMLKSEKSRTICDISPEMSVGDGKKS